MYMVYYCRYQVGTAGLTYRKTRHTMFYAIQVNIPFTLITHATDDELNEWVDQDEMFDALTISRVEAEIERRNYDASDPSSAVN